MRQILSPTISDRAAGCRRLVPWLLAALAAPGCRHGPHIEFISTTKPATVQLIQPKFRNIVRVVGQPSFIESYERTSIYPKPTAYIQKWIVDIGDRVEKNEVLATLFAPSWSRSSRQRRRTSCSTGSVSRWPTRRWTWRRPTSMRPTPASGWPRRSSTNTRPRSTAGARRSSGSNSRSPGPWSMPKCFSSRPISSCQAPQRWTRRRRPLKGRRPTCSARGPGSKRLTWTSGSPKPP